MKLGIFTLLLSAAAVSANAQCGGTSISKSGTGMTRTYTAVHAYNPTAAWTYTWNTYPTGFSSATGPSVTRNFTYGGIYTTYLNAALTSPITCNDNANVADTIIGPMDCASANLFLSAATTSTYTRTFTPTLSGAMVPLNYSVAYSYDYGDMTTGSSNVHTYASAGNYTVTVTATYTASGYPTCTKTKTLNVTVTTPPTFNCATAQVGFTYTNNGNTYTFVNTTTPSALPTGVFVTYNWSYGNGATAIGTGNKIYTYPTTGNYDVKLKATWYSNSPYTVLCVDSVVNNITVGGSTPVPNQLSGTVRWDSSLTANYAPTTKIWLVQLDTTNLTLNALDSLTITGATGAGRANFSFGSRPIGHYRLKAHITNQLSSVNGFIPTYDSSKAYWNMADSFLHGGGSTSRIWWLMTGTQTVGNGFIGGSVVAGANKGTAAGDPVANQLILLRNSAGKLIRSVYTGADGKFSFVNIPSGNYTVYPEEMNYKTTVSRNITITGFENTVNGINFRKNDGEHTIVPVLAAGVESIAAKAGYFVYPNPTSGRVMLSAPAGAQAVKLTLTSVTGQVVFSQENVSFKSGTLELDFSQIAPGLYNLAVQNAGRIENCKLLLQR